MLNRAIVFYGLRYQIISLDYYGDYMCYCKLIGEGFYLEETGTQDIEIGTWANFEAEFFEREDYSQAFFHTSAAASTLTLLALLLLQ